MALLHNSIFRGYNSIYLQAPHVQDADKADFIGYALTWFKFVKSHHDDEEETLFTKVEELLEDKTVFEDTHKEHGTSGVNAWVWCCHAMPRQLRAKHSTLTIAIRRVLPPWPGRVQQIPTLCPAQPPDPRLDRASTHHGRLRQQLREPFPLRD